MKSWYKSKTILFNTAAAVLASLEASTSILQATLSVDAYKYLTLGLVVGNVILRAVSETKLTK